MLYDIAIIGGGAAGLTAAIHAKKQQPQLNIAVFESLDRVGKKLITTGNGRCNITNRYADVSRYHGEGVSLIESVFTDYSVDDDEPIHVHIRLQVLLMPCDLPQKKMALR